MGSIGSFGGGYRNPALNALRQHTNPQADGTSFNNRGAFHNSTGPDHDGAFANGAFGNGFSNRAFGNSSR